MHFPQSLTAEVQHEAPLHPRRVDVQTAQSPLRQLRVVVVALVLHTGVQGGHRQIVGVHNVVDVAGKPEGELGHGDEQGVAAAGGGALYVHSGAAGGLAQAAAHVLAQTPQTLDQPQGSGGLTLPQGGGGDGGDLDVLAVGLLAQTLHDTQEIQLGRSAVGQQLGGQQSQTFTEPLCVGKLTLRRRADLPVLVDGGVQCHPAGGVGVAAVLEVKCHAAPSLLYVGVYSK